MNCWHCGARLVWSNDFSFDEVGLEGEGIATRLNCSNCSAIVEVYLPLDEE